MATITAAMVKELREATQAGMMECKKALTECDGDMKKASEYLQIKGLAKAAKRGARKTSEGYIGMYRDTDDRGIAIVEVCCETDFVARTDNFKNFCNELAKGIYDLKPAADANLLELSINGETIEVKRGNLSAATGENIRIGRFARVETASGRIAAYRHHDGKGCVACTVTCEKADTINNDTFKDFCFELALHAFSANPAAINVNELDAQMVEDQKNVFIQKTREEGKPEARLEQIAMGRMNAWYAEIVLVKQIWCGEGKESVEAKLAACAKAVSDKLAITSLNRIVIGEGVKTEGEEEEA